MKKPSITLLTLGLTMLFAVDGCRKEEPFPLEPDSEIAAELAAITFTPITLVQPEPVTESPGDVQTSAAMIAFDAALDRITEESVPAEIQVFLDAVTTTLSEAEIDRVNELTDQQLDDFAASGVLPADLQAIFDKLDANPVLQAALPKVIFPVVDGTTIFGGRTGVVETIEKSEGIEVEDQCVVAANAAFAKKKTELDNSKAEEVAKINAAYEASTIAFSLDRQECMRQAKLQFDEGSLKVRAKGLTSRYWFNIMDPRGGVVFHFVVSIRLYKEMVAWNKLLKSVEKACESLGEKKNTSAINAQKTNMAAAEAEYQTKLSLAQTKRNELIKSCHNQGSGK